MVSKGFPNVITSGRQYNIGEKPSVILYTYIVVTLRLWKSRDRLVILAANRKMHLVVRLLKGSVPLARAGVTAIRASDSRVETWFSILV